MPTVTSDPSYGWTKRLGKMPMSDARAKLADALKAEGFGVLTEIDVQATIEKKLGKKIAPYVILGACNPNLADRALELDPGVGLLLPCNVTLRQEGGETILAIARPDSMFQVVANRALEPIAREAEERLHRVADAVH